MEQELKQPLADPEALIARFGLTVVDGKEAEELDRRERLAEERSRRERLEAHYVSPASGVPERYWGESLDTFKPWSEETAEALAATRRFVGAKDCRILMLCGANGTGKEEWVEQTIPTPQGFRRFGDLKAGDYVYNADGKPTMVLGVYPQGMKDSYRVTFSDGRTDECGLEHLWGVYTMSHGTWKYKVMSIKEIIERGVNRKDGSARFSIPASPIIDGEEKDLPCHPYILGSFIGNGCNTGERLCLSSNDEWNVRKCASILGCDVKKYCKKNYSWIFWKEHALKTKDYLPEEICCLSYEKSIPQEYLFASIEQRKNLLQGLFDTDGCAVVSDGRLHVTYSTSSKKLSEDVRTLLLSFGIVSTIIENKRGVRINYCLNVNCSVDKARMLFSLPRKLDKVNDPNVKKGSHRDYSKVKIKRIEKLPQKREMMCIYVANEKHLYLTNDFLVTHNTHLGCGAVRERGGIYIPMLRLMYEVDGSMSFKAKESKIQLLDRICDASLVVLDELARVKVREEMQMELAVYVICERYSRGKSTMLIGNPWKNDLVKWLGMAVKDRMNECGEVVELHGQSYRIRKRAEVFGKGEKC